MKGFILSSLLFSGVSAFAMDPASQFVQTTLTQAQQALSLKSTDAQVAQFCSLIQSNVDITYVGTDWLGDYATTTQDQSGINLFMQLVPSMFVTKLMPYMSKAVGGNFQVGDTATDQGDGTFSVSVTLTSENGDSYNGQAIVENQNGYKVKDVNYMGFSAVDYFAGQYQDILNDQSSTNPNAPVTGADQVIMSQKGFIRCPSVTSN